MSIKLTSDFKRGRSDNEVYINCPFCITKGKSADTGYHLGLNTQHGFYHCHRCDAKGRVKNFDELALLSEAEEQTSFNDLKNKVVNMFSRDRFESKIIDLEKISYPLTAHDTPIAYNYIINDRKLSVEEINKLKLRVGKKYTENDYVVNKWSGRVLFPFFENEQVVFIVGRTYVDASPKYINSTGSKGNVVYGIDNVKGEAILCEGIISAIAAERVSGVPAISVLGKSPTEAQLTKIRGRCEKLYISLDGGVELTTIKKIVRRCMQMNFKVWLISLPELYDPDELGGEYVKYFKDAKKISLL